MVICLVSRTVRPLDISTRVLRTPINAVRTPIFQIPVFPPLSPFLVFALRRVKVMDEDVTDVRYSLRPVNPCTQRSTAGNRVPNALFQQSIRSMWRPQQAYHVLERAIRSSHCIAVRMEIQGLLYVC